MTRRIDKFREMNSNELQIQHRELSQQVFTLRFQLSSGQSEGLKKLREAKKDLARVNTLMRQVQLSGAQAAPAKSSEDTAAEPQSGRRAAKKRKG